nr:DnaD domain protein [Carnobacterium divergens]
MPNPFSFYETNGFGMLTPFYQEKIGLWIDDFKLIGSTEDEAKFILIKAMEVSLMNNVRKWVYVESILKNWEQKKLSTVEMIDADELSNKASNQSSKQYKKNYVRTETLPEWAKDEYEEPPVKNELPKISDEEFLREMSAYDE